MFLTQSGMRRKSHDSDNWFHQHSLSIAVAAILLLQMLSTIWSGHIEWIRESALHGETVSGWPTDFWTFWGWEYLVSVAAEPWGFLIGVILTKWFYERDSAESD